MSIATRISALVDRTKTLAIYLWQGVWRDPSASMKVRIIKTLNLSVRTFLDTGLQTRAQSLVYTTLLAIVPALALLLAIGRGFGLQNLLQEEIIRFFPSQQRVMTTAMGFVDSYLKETSQGLIVGIGIVFLLWTLISLLSDIENAFNTLWGVKQGRALYRKVTDYTSICLMVPVLMVLSAGINIFMATFMESVFGKTLLSPLSGVLLDCAPFVLCCVAFTISFLVIPNTHVRLKYAAISGVICGVAFQLLQTLFIFGQIYVAKYNAIYGSFAFLPLLLIWLQLSWLIVLFGCTLTFSLQNIFHYTFSEENVDIAPVYMRQLVVAVAAVIVSRFNRGESPCTLGHISVAYGLPIRLVRQIAATLHECNVIYYVELDHDETGVAPAIDLSTFTLGELLKRVDNAGGRDFVPDFEHRYAPLIAMCLQADEAAWNRAGSTLLRDVPAPRAQVS